MTDEAALALVRVLISDIGDEPLLDDDAIGLLLEINGGSPRLAAADALEAIAVSEVLVSKKIRTQDLQTDGPAVASELRALATALRKRAAELGEDAAASEFFSLVDTGRRRRAPELSEPEVWGM